MIYWPVTRSRVRRVTRRNPFRKRVQPIVLTTSDSFEKEERDLEDGCVTECSVIIPLW